METLDRVYQDTQSLFWQAVAFISDYLLQIEIWLRQPMGHVGLSSKLQVISMIGLCCILSVVALRAFGGIVRAAVLIVVAALFVHLLTTQVHFLT